MSSKTTNLRRATSASRWKPCAPSAFRCTCCLATTIRSMRRRCTPAHCSPPNAPTTSRFSTAPGVHEVRPGLQIVAAPWRSKKPTSDLVSEVLDGLPADGVTRIVVGHGGVDIFEPDKDKPSLIRLAALEAAIERGAVHYIALGDKHSRTQVGCDGPHLVLRVAGGHQLRRHRTRSGSRAARRHRRGRSPAGLCGSTRDASDVGASSRSAAPWTAVATWPTSTSTST